jgi:PAS domain S-box-containing protein
MKSVKDAPEQISESIQKITDAVSNAQSDHYRSIIEAAQDMIFIHNPEGKITYVNKASTSESGYSEEELLSLNVAQNVPPSIIQKCKSLRSRGCKVIERSLPTKWNTLEKTEKGSP